MKKLKKILLTTASIIVFISGVNITQASNCQVISNAPVTISTPGHYCLNKSLTVSLAGKGRVDGVAINIAANDVTLDLNGHSLIGSGDKTQEQYGIFSAGFNNIVIKNGKVLNFTIGMHLDRKVDLGKNNHVDNMTVEGFTVWGIGLLSHHSQITNTRIGNAVGTPSGSGGFLSGIAEGIFFNGVGTRIQNVSIYNIQADGAFGIVNNLSEGSYMEQVNISNITGNKSARGVSLTGFGKKSGSIFVPVLTRIAVKNVTVVGVNGIGIECRTAVGGFDHDGDVATVFNSSFVNVSGQKIKGCNTRDGNYIEGQ